MGIMIFIVTLKNEINTLNILLWILQTEIEIFNLKIISFYGFVQINI